MNMGMAFFFTALLIGHKKARLCELPHKNGTLIKKTGMKGMTI